MSATKIVLDILLADAAITDVVEQAITPVRAEQMRRLPYIVATLVSEGEDQLLAGASGLFEARVAVICHAATFAEVDDLGEMVKASLGNVINRTTAGGTATTWKAGDDVSDWSDDFSTFRRTIDFVVRWHG